MGWRNISIFLSMIVFYNAAAEVAWATRVIGPHGKRLINLPSTRPMLSQFIDSLKKVVISPAFAYCSILLFFLLKLFHLDIPYFWDELGVYSRAALAMYDSEITLLPGVISPDLSRGHPLLCTAFFAAAFRFLGPHVWVGHLAALAVSILLLVILYRSGKRLTDHTTGLIACLLLMSQSVFIAQSSMVLPEVLLALFSTAALFAYIGNRLTLFAFYASLAIMTKETAIALPVTVWSIEALRWVLGRRAEAVKACIAASIPVVCWGVFLLLQKKAHGWYFFPLHEGYISFSMDQIIARGAYYLNFLFRRQGRLLWTIFLVSALLAYFLNRREGSFSRIVEDVQEILVEKKTIAVLFIFICWGLVVSILNFHLGRYSLFILPSLCVVVAQSFLAVYDKLKKDWLQPIAVALLLLTPLSYYASNTFNYDADMGFMDIVEVHAQTVDFLNRNYNSGTVIMDSWPIKSCMIETRSGYANGKKFEHLDRPCQSPGGVDADIFVYSYPGNLEQCRPETSQLSLLQEFTSSFAKVLIFAKR